MFGLATKRCWRTEGVEQPGSSSNSIKQRPARAKRRISVCGRLVAAPASHPPSTPSLRIATRKETRRHLTVRRCQIPCLRLRVCIVAQTSPQGAGTLRRMVLSFVKIGVRRGPPARPTIMETQVLADQVPANEVATLSLTTPQLDAPLTERQMAELHEVWLEHQVNPLGEIQSRGVPYSALNE
jgi:hypothetical protein